MDQDETLMWVGLSPGHIVFDGDPALPEKAHNPPPPNAVKHYIKNSEI